MKKFLLSAAAVMVAATSFAGVDPYAYEVKNGIELKNRWLKSQALDAAVLAANPDAVAEYGQFQWEIDTQHGKARMAAIVGEEVLVSYCKNYADAEGEDAVDHAHILVYDLASGDFKRELVLTHEGTPITGLLCAVNLSVDSYGNAFVSGLSLDAVNTPFNFYTFDLETGVCTLQASLTIPAADADLEADALGKPRVDFPDVTGDITGVQSHAYIGTALGGTGKPLVALWYREQGAAADAWVGAYDVDGEKYALWVVPEEGITTFPAGGTNFGSSVGQFLFVEDETCSGDLFYVDPYQFAPMLYNKDAASLDGMNNAPADLQPEDNSANGICEFELAGQQYFAYVINQYTTGTKGGKCNIVSAPGYSFADMSLMWQFPAPDGMGTVSDGGQRIHCLLTTPVMKDENGKEGLYIVNFKCHNGLGVYSIAEEGWQDPNGEVIGGIEGITADDLNAPAEYYNLQGVKVANPENGLYIVKRGNKAVKQYVVK